MATLANTYQASLLSMWVLASLSSVYNTAHHVADASEFMLDIYLPTFLIDE